MKEIILDDSLEISEIKQREFNSQYFFDGAKGFTPVTDFDAEIRHRNYLDYLALCWNNHYGVVISPTIIWNIILNNLAFEVNKTPEVFRKYFTESNEKQEIIVNQDGYLIDVKLLIAGVSGKMPTNIMDNMFPELTTDTNKSIVGNYTAFLDMVSPYYNYSMLLCGIPKVRVLGTMEDWMKILDACAEIYEIIPEFKNYLGGLMMHVNDIKENSVVYEDMFSLQRCGSGSQVEVSGWIRDFFIEQPRVPYPENFVSCIAKIDYHNYNDGDDYRMYAGLFASKIENDYLIPEFNNVYFKKEA